MDANEFFSAIIGKGRKKSSKALDIFFSGNALLFAPLWLLDEFENNKGEIMEKAGFSNKEFDSFINGISSRITFIPLAMYANRATDAMELSPHKKDKEYFALALKLGAPIWSEEKAFKKQPVVQVFNTQELYDKLFMAKHPN